MTNTMENINEKDTPQTDEDGNIIENPQDKDNDLNKNKSLEEFQASLAKGEDEDDEAYQERLKEIALKRNQSANDLYVRLNRKKDEPKQALKPEVSKKPKQEQTVTEETILEQASLMNSGLDLEDLKLLKDIQKLQELKGEEKSLTELVDNPMFKSHISEKKQKIEEEKKNLPPSRGGNKVEKIPEFKKKDGRFDHEKHQAWIKENMAK